MMPTPFGLEITRKALALSSSNSYAPAVTFTFDMTSKPLQIKPPLNYFCLLPQARGLAPAIIFIDEIDAIGRIRGRTQGNDERDQTLNQLLSLMDGFEGDTSVIVIAATNRRDVLDPALIRPGRFDRIIRVDRPDFEGRIEILQVG